MRGLYSDKRVKTYIWIVLGCYIGIIFVIGVLRLLDYFTVIKVMEQYKIGIMIFFILLLMLLTIYVGYHLLVYINDRLSTINENVSKAMNGHLAAKEDYEPEYEEGPLYSLDYQLNSLISKLYTNREQSILEKKKLNSLVTEITHQLKTPVAAIKLFHSLLESSDISIYEKNNIISKLGDEISRIEWLTGNFTDLSKLETGLIQLNLKTRNIHSTITQAVNTIYLAAEEKSIDITLVGEKDGAFRYDEKWTKEALVNILDNAIKYSDIGDAITIEIISTAMHNKIHITDSGKGISKKDMPFIFNRFYKSQENGNHEGIGIGLYLAKEIMKNQNGTIKVYSQLGKGTTFELIFYKS